MAVSIKFIGAAHTVTGSCYIVKSDQSTFIVDCGMYQGPDVEIRNLEEFTFDPAEIDFVLLTHTHLDHVGLLPKLVKHGFTGPIFMTLHTAQIAEVILLDSAKIQENNYAEGKPWKHAKQVALIYDKNDAHDTIRQFEIVRLHESFRPAIDVEVEFVAAGHVLGAASIHVRVEDKNIVFSGDIGRAKQELIPGFEPETDFKPNAILTESLYGGQIHPDRHESVQQLVEIIRETTARGGSVFIPSFAVQRTQEILHDLKLAKQSGALADDLQVILDSPMAQRVTNIYAAALDQNADSKLNFPGLHYVKNGKKSQKISRRTGIVVIAGSGMADGGRIVTHLAQNISHPRNAVVFVGYQAEATLGRALVEGAKMVTIDETLFEVRAQIYHLAGFSAHGDTNDYQIWIDRFDKSNLEKVFLIHAEPERSELYRQQLAQNGYNMELIIPDREEEIQI